MSSETHEEVTYIFPSNNIKKTSLTVFDFAFSALIVAPLTVFAWCSTWDLMDAHPRIFPGIPSLCFSTTIMIGFTVARLVFKEAEVSPKSVLVRVYIYFYFVVCVMQWRAAWLLIDEGLAFGAKFVGLKVIVVVLTVVLVSGLFGFRCLKSSLATPFSLGVDDVGTAFDFPTRWKFRVSIVYNFRVGIIQQKN